MPTDVVRSRPIAQLSPNPNNPRGAVYSVTVEDLAASIRSQGILQPLLVLPNGTVVAGHRRLAAAKMAGLAEVPVIERKLTETEQLEIMLVENIQRDDLSPLQEARGFQQLMDQGLTQSNVARRIGVPSNRVQSRLGILKLYPEVQELYARHDMPTAIVSTLARVTDARQQLRFANMIARRQIPTPRLEQLIKRSLGELEEIAARQPPAPDEVPKGANGLSPTRMDLLTKLRAESETTISFEDLAKAVEDTCCWCGMEDVADVCGNCPMPQLVARIVSAA